MADNREKLLCEMGHQWVLCDISNWNSHREEEFPQEKKYSAELQENVWPCSVSSAQGELMAPQMQSFLPPNANFFSFFFNSSAVWFVFVFFPPSIYLLFKFWRKGMRFLFYAWMVLSPLTQNPEVLTEYERIINHHHCGLGGFYSLPSPLWCFFKRKGGEKNKTPNNLWRREEKQGAWLGCRDLWRISSVLGTLCHQSPTKLHSWLYDVFEPPQCNYFLVSLQPIHYSL